MHLEKRRRSKGHHSHLERPSVEGGTSSVSTDAPIMSSTGIAGILKHEEKTRENVKILQKGALGDLRNLVDNAADVLGILEKYTAILEREESSQDYSTSEAGDISEIEDILRNIGIVRSLPLFYSRLSKILYFFVADCLTNELINLS
jgi:hypothetical protein